MSARAGPKRPLAALAALAVGAAILVEAAPVSVAALWRQLQVAPLAELYAGRPVAEGELRALTAAQRLALAAHPSAAHETALAAALLRRILLDRPADPAGHELFESALTATTRSLAKSPADPRGWLQLAWLRTLAEGPGQGVARALALSLRTGTQEAPPILEARLRLLLANVDHLDPATEAATADQIRLLWQSRPAAVVELAALADSRQKVVRALADEPGAPERLGRLLRAGRPAR